MSSRTWVKFAVAILALQTAIAQTTGSGSTGTTTGTTGSTTGSTGTGRGRSLPTNPGDPTTTTTNNTTTSPMDQPSIIISGRVMVEDGTPPPTGTVIERVCGGSAHSEGYTDTRGYFVVTLGQNRGQIMDASDSQNEFGMGRTFPSSSGAGMGSMGGTPANRPMMDNRFSNCEIRARLAGYRSQAVALIDHRAMDTPDIGTILLHRMGPAESSTIEATSLAAPKNAHKAYTKGLDLLKKQQSDEARKSFESAVQIYPTYSAAWLELGKLQAVKGDLEQAYHSFDEARKAEPRLVGPYLELSLLAMHNQSWSEVADLTAQALKLDSFQYPQAWYMNALAHYNMGNFETAEKDARNVRRLDTRGQFPQAARLLGVLLMNRRDYSAAADQFREYLVMAPRATDATQVRRQLTDLERIVSASAQVAK